MAEERVAMPVTLEDGTLGFEDAMKTVREEDESMWCSFRCKGIREITMRKGGISKVQEFTFSVCGKDENGDYLKRPDGSGYGDWYEMKVTLWPPDATNTIKDGNYVDKDEKPLEWADWAAGDRLATLFAGDPKRGIRCRIIFNPRKCYGNPGKGRVWYKYDEPEEPDDLFLSRPMKKDCTDEQNALWDEIEKQCRDEYKLQPGWVKLFTAQAANPFKKPEQEEETRQAVPAGDVDDDLGL